MPVSEGGRLGTPVRVLLSTDVILNIAVVALLFIPWRNVRVNTSASISGRTLSFQGTRRAVSNVHEALFIQSLLRVGAEIVVLICALITIAIIGSIILGVGKPRWPLLSALAVANVVLTGATYKVLPLIETSAGLSVHLTISPTPASLFAFVVCFLALTMIVIAWITDRNRSTRLAHSSLHSTSV